MMMKLNLFLIVSSWVALLATVVSAKDQQGLRGRRDLEVHNEPDASEYFEGSEDEEFLSLEEMDEMGLDEEDRDLGIVAPQSGRGDSRRHWDWGYTEPFGSTRGGVSGSYTGLAGYGSGYGSSGYGSGYGTSGYGRGNGYGYGSGYDNGYGYGSGYGSGRGEYGYYGSGYGSSSGRYTGGGYGYGNGYGSSSGRYNGIGVSGYGSGYGSSSNNGYGGYGSDNSRRTFGNLGYGSPGYGYGY